MVFNQKLQKLKAIQRLHVCMHNMSETFNCRVWTLLKKIVLKSVCQPPSLGVYASCKQSTLGLLVLADKLSLNLIFSVIKGVLEQVSVLVCLPIKIVSNYCMSSHFARHSLQVIICSASPINMHVNSTVLPNRPLPNCTAEQ